MVPLIAVGRDRVSMPAFPAITEECVSALARFSRAPIVVDLDPQSISIQHLLPASAQNWAYESDLNDVIEDRVGLQRCLTRVRVEILNAAGDPAGEYSMVCARTRGLHTRNGQRARRIEALLTDLCQLAPRLGAKSVVAFVPPTPDEISEAIVRRASAVIWLFEQSRDRKAGFDDVRRQWSDRQVAAPKTTVFRMLKYTKAIAPVDERDTLRVCVREARLVHADDRAAVSEVVRTTLSQLERLGVAYWWRRLTSRRVVLPETAASSRL